jgi:osmotically inducible lipoprotein OsmB
MAIFSRSESGLAHRVCRPLGIISVSLTCLLSLGACSGWKNLSKGEQGAVVGAGVGGVAGSVMSGGSTMGTAAGAAVGGLIGHEVNKGK